VLEEKGREFLNFFITHHHISGAKGAADLLHLKLDVFYGM
jgi:hypothetical protein